MGLLFSWLHARRVFYLPPLNFRVQGGTLFASFVEFHLVFFFLFRCVEYWWQFFQGFALLFFVDFGVDDCGGQGGVAHECLDYAHVRTRVE